MNPNAEQFVVSNNNSSVDRSSTRNNNNNINNWEEYKYHAEEQQQEQEEYYHGNEEYYDYNDVDGSNYNYYGSASSGPVHVNAMNDGVGYNSTNESSSSNVNPYYYDYEGTPNYNNNNNNEGGLVYEGGMLLAEQLQQQEEEAYYGSSSAAARTSVDPNVVVSGDEYFYSGGHEEGYYYELLPMGGVLASNNNNNNNYHHHHHHHHHDSIVPISAISMDELGIYVGTNTVPLSRTSGSSLLNIYNFYSHRNDTLELHACTCAHPSLSFHQWQSILQSSLINPSSAILHNNLTTASASASASVAASHHHHHHASRRQRYNNILHSNTSRLMTAIPKHAYRPTFDIQQSSSTSVVGPANVVVAAAAVSSPSSSSRQLGISQILPLPSNHYFGQQSLNSNHNDNHNHDDDDDLFYNNSNNNIIVTVSPWGIRLHSRGAVLQSSHPLEGTFCCSASNTSSSSSTHNNMYYDHHHHHDSSSLLNLGGTFGFSTYDIYTNQIISTCSIRSSNPYNNINNSIHNNNNSNNNYSTTTIMDIKPTIDHHTTNNAQKYALACADGTLRFWDIRTKYGEIAQVPCHDGGVVHLDTYQHHVATTGYSSSTTNTTNAYTTTINKHNSYNIPDPNVHTFDVRYLGRGGILHPFTGLAGGPRFLKYIPPTDTQTTSSSLKLLVASGQVGGGIQIMDMMNQTTTTTTTTSTTQDDTSIYIDPPLFLSPDTTNNNNSHNNNEVMNNEDNSLLRGESITDICTFQDRFAIGTSFGNIYHYRFNQPPSSSSIPTKTSPTYALPIIHNHNNNTNNINSMEEFPTLDASMIASQQQQQQSYQQPNNYNNIHNNNNPPTLHHQTNLNNNNSNGGGMPTTVIHANILLDSHITSSQTTTTSMPQSFSKIITALSTKSKINHNFTHAHELFLLSHLKNNNSSSSSSSSMKDPYNENTDDTFGPLSQQIICRKGNKLLSNTLKQMIQQQQLQQQQQNSNKHLHHSKDDFLISLSVPTIADAAAVATAEHKKKQLVYENYNQYLYSKTHANICYNMNADPRCKPYVKQYHHNQHYSSSKQPSASSSTSHHSSKRNYQKDHSYNHLPYESSSNFHNNDDSDHPFNHNAIKNEHYNNNSLKKNYTRTNEQRALWKKYACSFRPPNSIWTTLEYASYNNTGKWVGWDYGPLMPNAYVPPILALFYFIPEIRMAVKKQITQNNNLRQKSQYNDTTTNNSIQESDGFLVASELGHLFHQIDCISAHAMTQHFSKNKKGLNKAVMGCFVPRNFLTMFGALPEASALALLDGAPAAVETPRRCEAFYRFAMHQFDKELSCVKGNNNNNNNNKNAHAKKTKATSTSTSKLMDALQGIDFVSMNEFVTGSGPPTISSTRAYTVELSYEPFLQTHSAYTTTANKKEKYHYFAEILQYSLCKDSRLRAWCDATKSFETVIQRKIATSLPTMLTLSCACAGTKSNGALALWKQIFNKDEKKCNQNQWLPELIEVEVEQSGNIIVSQCINKNIESDISNETTWKSFKGKGFPTSASAILAKSSNSNNNNNNGNAKNMRNRRYRLEAVVSYIKNNHDNVSETSTLRQQKGHHVVHVRVPNDYGNFAISQQIRKIKNCLGTLFNDNASSSTTDSKKDANNNEIDDTKPISIQNDAAEEPWTLTAHITKETYESRLQLLEDELQQQTDNKGDNEWILLNGLSVSKVDVSEVCSFHNIDFKEPCIVIYRQVEGKELTENVTEQLMKSLDWPKNDISYKVMNSLSLTNGSLPSHVVSSPSDLPGCGDLVALDAEFVQVGHEESELTSNGSKVIVKEGRNALARISLIDCRTGMVIIDDHILPKEPVIDYLTRFSGVEPRDLDPRTSSHHLITLQRAYLKIRYLVDRGCIFVGHGLSQDFFMINLFVPPSQIIDTLHIYHQDNRRYISLRFLANCVLGHDMQQDVHDSIEDANASFKLYLKAREAQKEGNFEKLLMDIYELGDRTDWKIGIEKRN